MKQRLARFALVALVPTAVDVGLLVWLRLGLGWILVAADLTAIAVATVVSYLLHRSITFRQDSFVRWVQMPWTFGAVAAVAAIVDVVVLRGIFAASGFETVAGLGAAKVGALSCAAVVRSVGYRTVLTSEVRAHGLVPGAPPERVSGEFDVSIVVPAWNEAEGIVAAIAELRAAADRLGLDVEVVVVDDGSPDGTADAALAAGAEQVVELPENRGKGAAVRAGMLAARGRSVAFTDADLAYEPDAVLEAARRIDDGWEVVVGDRRHPDARGQVGSSSLRSIGSRLINLATYAVLLGSYRDTQCGLKAFRRDVAHRIFSRTRIDGFAFDVEVLHLIERDRLSMLTLPATARHSDRSSVRIGRDAIHVLRDLWRVRHWSATGAYEPPAAASGGSPVGRDARAGH